MAYWDTPSASDEWYTPIDALGCRFDADVAASVGQTNVPADRFLSCDSQYVPWHGFVWMNPPFGGRNGVAVWLRRFFDHGHGIALTADRTSTPWFWEAWDRADVVLFTRKIRFFRPDGSEGVSPSNGTALWAAGERAVTVLHRARDLGFGILAKAAA